MIKDDYTPKPGQPWADEQLLPAEKKLLAAAKVGEPGTIRTDLKDPAEGEWSAFTRDHEIRAELIRHMLIDPNAYDLDPKGLEIIGARIKNVLDLENLAVMHRLVFMCCQFGAAPVLRHARTLTINFQACRLPGLQGDGLKVSGGLFLRQCQCTKEVRLVAADVQGNIETTDSIFTNEGKGAFTASGIQVHGSLYLSNVTVTGNTLLLSAVVKGNLDCSKATFVNKDAIAFNGQRLTVKGRLLFRDMKTSPIGIVDFMHAHVGDWIDDESAWPAAGNLILDGLVYDNLSHYYDADTRKRWLALQPKVDHEGKPALWPQPYEQLAKVLKAAGHLRDARLIAIAKQDALRAYLRRKAAIKNKDAHGNELDSYVKGDARYMRRLWLCFSRWAIRYGYESWRAAVILLGILLFGTATFAYINDNGLMEPAKERIYTHACYTDKTDCPHWIEIYHRGANGDLRYVPPDYPDFNAFTYSLDVLLPIVDMKLETHWVPGSRGFWGTLGRVYFWLHIALGWVFTTIAVVGFTGLVKQDKD